MSAHISLEEKDNEAKEKKKTINAADLIVHYLEQIGVEYVFGVPGGAIEPLFNALARSARRGRIRPIVSRHESGAAFMADGYTRETGKIGVCCATTGPGATNMITGVASAYQDNIPMLALTAQTPLNTFGKGAAQESSCTSVDTVGMFQYCTLYNSLISHPEQLENKLISAIMAAYHASGPAHLSIPLDILREPIKFSSPTSNLESLLQIQCSIDDNAVSKLQKLLEQNNNLVFVIGAEAGEAIGSILELAALLNAQIITTPQGKGLISSYHPLYRGVFGIAGHDTARSTLSHSSVDLIVAIGTDLDEQATCGWDTERFLNRKLIHIDSKAHNFSRSQMAQLHVHGRLVTIFDKLLVTLSPLRALQTPAGITAAAPVINFERRMNSRRGRTPGSDTENGANVLQLNKRQGKDRRSGSSIPRLVSRHFELLDESKYFDDSTPIKPQRLMYELARRFPPNTRFLADIGNSFLWAIHYLHPYNRRITGKRAPNHSTFRTSMGFASMGWSIGAAVGTALACKDNPVVCIVGDGSFLMSGQEITVAITEELPVIFVILNDAALGTVKHGQRLAGAEPIGYELPQIDFCKFAQAMGAYAHAIRSPDDLMQLDIAAICKRRGPTLLDVYIDPEEAPPLGERLEMLASGKTTSKSWFTVYE